jgi:hypothetical protein
MHVLPDLPLGGGIKIAQSPLFDRPPLMRKSRPSPSIQRSQGRDVRYRLSELTTEMAQNRRRHVFQRVQCGSGHPDETELQSGTDPEAGSELLADRVPIARIERKPLLQTDIW